MIGKFDRNPLKSVLDLQKGLDHIWIKMGSFAFLYDRYRLFMSKRRLI